MMLQLVSKRFHLAPTEGKHSPALGASNRNRDCQIGAVWLCAGAAADLLDFFLRLGGEENGSVTLTIAIDLSAVKFLTIEPKS